MSTRQGPTTSCVQETLIVRTLRVIYLHSIFRLLTWTAITINSIILCKISPMNAGAWKMLKFNGFTFRIIILETGIETTEQ